MKTKIVLSILLLLVYLGIHFYFVPRELSQVAVDQLKDTPNSTANVRVSTTLFDSTFVEMLTTYAIIWWKPVADLFKKMKNKIITTTILASLILAGCSEPVNVPDIQTIEPSQTAFVIPLEGQTSNQSSFDSEAFLQNAKVATKRIIIPKRWRSLGRSPSDGEFIPTVKVIIVERRPEGRHWADKNAIVAESKESIGFSVPMSVTSQIDEPDAAKFLYRYNNKPLKEIIDEEVLNRVRSKFVEESSKFELSSLLLHKQDIMNSVRNDVVPYFKERGINITSLGMAGELTYLDDGIQASINKKFQAAQDLIAQKATNEKVISKAEADAKAAQILNNPNALKLKQIEMQSRWIEKWDGHTPTVTGSGSGVMLNVDSLLKG